MDSSYKNPSDLLHKPEGFLNKLYDTFFIIKNVSHRVNRKSRTHLLKKGPAFKAFNAESRPFRKDEMVFIVGNTAVNRIFRHEIGRI